MLKGKDAPWPRGNIYDVAPCEHCQAVIRHERWCITRNTAVFYAKEIVMYPNRLTPEDGLRLHALGVRWNGN
jgi:hypothetical protein